MAGLVKEVQYELGLKGCIGVGEKAEGENTPSRNRNGTYGDESEAYCLYQKWWAG